MDIGYLGILLFLVYTIWLITWLFYPAKKFYLMITNVRVSLSEMFMIDFLGKSIRTLMFFSSHSPDNFLKILSVVLSVFFILVFSSEFLYQFIIIRKLALKKED